MISVPSCPEDAGAPVAAGEILGSLSGKLHKGL